MVALIALRRQPAFVERRGMAGAHDAVAEMNMLDREAAAAAGRSCADRPFGCLGASIALRKWKRLAKGGAAARFVSVCSASSSSSLRWQAMSAPLARCLTGGFSCAQRSAMRALQRGKKGHPPAPAAGPAIEAAGGSRRASRAAAPAPRRAAARNKGGAGGEAASRGCRSPCIVRHREPSPRRRSRAPWPGRD